MSGLLISISFESEHIVPCFAETLEVSFSPWLSKSSCRYVENVNYMHTNSKVLYVFFLLATMETGFGISFSIDWFSLILSSSFSSQIYQLHIYLVYSKRFFPSLESGSNLLTRIRVRTGAVKGYHGMGGGFLVCDDQIC